MSWALDTSVKASEIIIGTLTIACIFMQFLIMRRQASIMLRQAEIMLKQTESMNTALVSDHERRKKQSTIEYINVIRAKYRQLNESLIDKFGRDHVINVSEIDPPMRTDISELLSTVEHMSVGVNVGVYDIHILERMSGSYMIKMFQRLHPYITHIREAKKNDNAYIEFEEVKLQLEALRRKPRNQRGNIRYAPENLALLGRGPEQTSP